MVPVKVWKDEWYPVYAFTLDLSQRGIDIELDEAFIREYVTIEARYCELQNVLRDKYPHR